MVSTSNRNEETLPPTATLCTTTVFHAAQACYVGMDIQDPNNLALQDTEGVVFASKKPFAGYGVTNRHPAGPRTAQTFNSSLYTHPTGIPPTSPRHGLSVSSPSQSRIRGGARGLAGPPPSVPLPQLPDMRSSPFASRTVTLIVGGPESPSKEEQPVTLFAHEQLLTSISPFFRAALQPPSPTLGSAPPASGFREATTGIITLPEERPEDVGFLLQWAYWRSLWDTTTTAQTHAPTATDDRGLHHRLIDPAVHAYRAWLAEKRLLKQTFGANSAELTAYRQRTKRPRPPSFGPLLRLYILADRYDVGRSLKWCICERVLWMGREANCVPDREDVALLWEGVGVLEGMGVGLKKVVLELFAGLTVGSARGLFVGEKGEGRVDEEEDDGDEGARWHPGFMRDLVCVMFETFEGCVRLKKGSEKGKDGHIWVERDEQARRKFGSFEQHRDGGAVVGQRGGHSLFH